MDNDITYEKLSPRERLKLYKNKNLKKRQQQKLSSFNSRKKQNYQKTK